MPGLAFDPHGGRLGHGKGHYDRLLASSVFDGAWKVGIGFDCQIVAKIPTGEHDVRMDAVVSETAIHRSPSG